MLKDLPSYQISVTNYSRPIVELFHTSLFWQIAKYKEEIQKLQASEAEIKALSFNYAAILKEKEVHP